MHAEINMVTLGIRLRDRIRFLDISTEPHHSGELRKARHPMPRFRVIIDIQEV